MTVCPKNCHPTNKESLNPKHAKKKADTEYYRIERNCTKSKQVKGVVDMSDDSSDCSNAENKLDNYYQEAHKIEDNLLGVQEANDKDFKFREAIKGVLRLEHIRKKISDTNYEKLYRTLNS